MRKDNWKSQKNKLIFVIDNLQIGGAELVFVDIVHLLNNKIGFDVLLITDTKRAIYYLPNNVNVIQLNRQSKFSFTSAYNLFNILKKYDVAHIHMRHTYKYLALIKFFTRLKLRFIFHDHLGVRTHRNLPFYLANFFKPDKYIGVSKESCEWATTVWKLRERHVVLLPNLPSNKFVDGFLKGQNKLNSLSSDCMLINNSMKFVCVGNIKPGKNQLFAINIVKKLKSNLTLIGMEQDAQYYNNVKKELNNEIRLIENCYNTNEILGDFTFGLMVSVNESGPLVLMEYLLSGLPFLSYKTGGISEILIKYFPDYFIDNLDSNSWISRIEYLTAKPQKIDNLIVEKILNEEFNRDVYRDKLLNLYK